MHAANRRLKSSQLDHMPRLAPLALLMFAIGCGHKDPSRSDGDASRCGSGFVPREGGRCCVQAAGPCTLAPVPRERVHVPARRFEFGASDWEARGEVGSRRIETAELWLDAHELTRADVGLPEDPARALAGVTRAEARAHCVARGGRLPKDDEWLAAAAAGSKAARRYPWGDTGLVCRRAAWGLEHGPCARGADGPDTVGAHPDGRSVDGVHDLTGNVAEWVETPDDTGLVRGGSYADDFAASLRTWAARRVDPSVREPSIGVRCAYDAPAP